MKRLLLFVVMFMMALASVSAQVTVDRAQIIPEKDALRANFAYSSDSEDMGRTTVSVMMYDYPLRATQTFSEFDDEIRGSVTARLPYDIEPGLYPVRIVASNDDFRRVTFRHIYVDESRVVWN
ncbi:MAG: hypothetical protein ACQEP1_00170 [Nanobdellota archaeon]